MPLNPRKEIAMLYPQLLSEFIRGGYLLVEDRYPGDSKTLVEQGDFGQIIVKDGVLHIYLLSGDFERTPMCLIKVHPFRDTTHAEVVNVTDYPKTLSTDKGGLLKIEVDADDQHVEVTHHYVENEEATQLSYDFVLAELTIL